MYLLGYDSGTSSIKATLLNAETGQVVASSSTLFQALFVLGGCLSFGVCFLWYRLSGKRERRNLVPRLWGTVFFLLGSYAPLAAASDFAKAEVFKDDKMVYLSATEYRLLLQFAQNLGEILTSEELLTNVWGEEYQDDKEILWVSISRLRHKLEVDPRNPQHIVTRSGLGYTMPKT